MRILLAFLVLLSLTLGGLLYRKSEEFDRKATKLEEMILYSRGLEGARRQVDSLSTQLENLAPSPIHELYIGQLRHRGLANPVEDLIADLQRHPELIPYPGELGGQMGFMERDRIRVLSRAWVYAPFDDGHVAGEAIFEYQVSESGSISWRIIESRRI